MQSDNLVFLQILRIPICELWQVKDRRGTCKSRGALQVLHSQSLNLFLLKFNDYYFALDRSLEVTGTYSETGKWHSFLLPTFGGFFIIKALESEPGPLFTNFETILGNTTLYRQTTGLEKSLGIYSANEAKDIEMKESGMREGLGKITEVFSKMLHPTNDSDSHPNQKIVRSFSDLLDVDSPGIPVIDVPRDQVSNLKLESEEIIRNHQGATEWIELRGEERPIKSRPDIPETGIRSEFSMQGPSGLELRGAGAGLVKEATTFGGSKTLTEKEGGHHHHHLLHHHHEGEGEGHHHHLLHHHGADNIRTCQHETGQDQQEIVGMENQRLPSYEIDNPKEHLVRGFRKASYNLSDPTEGIKFSADEQEVDLGLPKIDEPEETEFTSGLFSNPEPILSKIRESETSQGEISKEGLKFEKWGSNITNASESTFKEDPFTGQNLAQNLGYSLGSRTNFGDPNLTKENLDKLGKQEQAPAKNILGEKTNISTQQKTSEKTKSQTTTQSTDKENVGGTYVI